MREISVGELEAVLANRKGDPVKLQSIIGKMKRKTPLNDSDKKYIEDLLSLKKSPSSEEEFVDVEITTTPNIEGSKIEEYLDIVSGEAIMGANIVRDWFAGVTDVIGGRSGQYEGRFREAKEIAIDEMLHDAIRLGANAVVGVSIDYEMVRESMMMVAVHGTAVKIVTEKK